MILRRSKRLQGRWGIHREPSCDIGAVYERRCGAGSHPEHAQGVVGSDSWPVRSVHLAGLRMLRQGVGAAALSCVLHDRLRMGDTEMEKGKVKAMSDEKEPVSMWAIVELFGHQKIAGLVK